MTTRNTQCRLQPTLLRLNSPNIAKLPAHTVFAVKWNGAFVKTCQWWQVSAFNWAAATVRASCFPFRPLTRRDDNYRGAHPSTRGDFYFRRSEFRTAET